MATFLFIMGMAALSHSVFTIRILNEIVRVHITASEDMKMELYKCVLSLMLNSFSFGVACTTIAWLFVNGA